jgi:hypothetical protein
MQKFELGAIIDHCAQCGLGVGIITAIYPYKPDVRQ